MSIKAGNIVFVGNGVTLLDRLQTAGPGAVNIKRETIYEVGDYLSVGQVTDIPDLTFSMESFDVSCALEAFLLNVDPKLTHTYDISTSLPVCVKSQIKAGKSAASPYATVTSASIPYLRVEQVSYKFGVGSQNASQTVQLRGDSLYYNEGSAYIESAAGSGSSGQTIVTANPAYDVVEGGVQRRILAIVAGNSRLNFGTDWTETYGAVSGGAATTTAHLTATYPSTTTIFISYASPTVESFPQSVHALVSGSHGLTVGSSLAGATSIQTDFNPGVGAEIILNDVTGSSTTETAKVTGVAGVSSPYTLTVAALTYAHSASEPASVYVPTVKPAALRGRDINVYVGPAFPVGTAHGTSRGTRKISVQSVTVDWRATLANDEELGNYHYVTTDFDVPQTSGAIAFRPRDPEELKSIMQTLSGVTAGSTTSSDPTGQPQLDVQIELLNPVDGRVLKRIHVPDARFSLPGFSVRAGNNSKLDFTSNFQSDQGLMYVYDN